MKIELLDPEPDTIGVRISWQNEDVTLQPMIEGTLMRLRGAFPSGEIGGPGLPKYQLRVALPPGANLSGIEFTTSDPAPLADAPLSLWPLQPPRPMISPEENPVLFQRMGDCESSRREKVRPPLPQPADIVPPDTDQYERAISNPAPFAELLWGAGSQIFPEAVILVAPLRLVAGPTVAFSNRHDIRIHYSIDEEFARGWRDRLGPGSGRSWASIERDLEIVAGRVVNPELIDQVIIDLHHDWRNQTSGKVDYLIITDDHTWDAAKIAPKDDVTGVAAAFDRLADWKTRRGLRCAVVRIKDIVDGKYGDYRSGAADLPEVLRRFLQWARLQWGVAWVLLGGTTAIVPAREAIGVALRYVFSPVAEGADLSKDAYKNCATWKGDHLVIRADKPDNYWPGFGADVRLWRFKDGVEIPFDADGSSGPDKPGFYPIDPATGARSATDLGYARVNGPKDLIAAPVAWVGYSNRIPTDFYYSSLAPSGSGADWDSQANRLFGKCNWDGDLDGVSPHADVSVGRAPVADAHGAGNFVAKLIGYERMSVPGGAAPDTDWMRGVAFASDDWYPPAAIFPQGDEPEGMAIPAGLFRTFPSHRMAVLRLPVKPDGQVYQVVAQVNANDLRVLPYLPFGTSIDGGTRGWMYVEEAWTRPAPFAPRAWPQVRPTSQLIAVFGEPEEIAPEAFVHDPLALDESAFDTEEARRMFHLDLPGLDRVSRLYTDYYQMDDDPPLQRLTGAGLLGAFQAGQGWIWMSGHGTPQSCCGIDPASASALSNGGQLPVVWADSCRTAAIDGENLGSALVANGFGGAIAYVGFSRYSWISEMPRFAPTFLASINRYRRLGVALDSRGEVLAQVMDRATARWITFATTLLGCPEMPVWTGAPHALAVQLVPSGGMLEVTVRDATTHAPMAGAHIDVRRGKWSRFSDTDSEGRASIPLDGPRRADVTVSKRGWLPWLGHT